MVAYRIRLKNIMLTVTRPIFRIWIKGKPKSSNKNRKSLSRYIKEIGDTAKSIVATPSNSNRLDIEIWFHAPCIPRPDVDNIIKPILDALKGTVYFDDNQVRSVRVVALPADDACKLHGSIEILTKIIKAEEFLINIYDNLRIGGSLQ